MTDALVVAVAPLAPEHCHIDIQTTDAGLGVGNDLDLQAHFYYAPSRDSKSHKVEQMSSLNEACGVEGFKTPIKIHVGICWGRNS